MWRRGGLLHGAATAPASFAEECPKPSEAGLKKIGQEVGQKEFEGLKNKIEHRHTAKIVVPGLASGPIPPPRARKGGRRPRKPRKRTHGSVVQRGDSFRVRWREGGRRRSASFPDRKTAEKVLLRIIGDVAAGRGGLEVEPRELPSLSKLAADWLDRRQHTHRNARGDRSMWNLHLKPAVGHLRPHEVDRATIRRLIETKLAAGLSSTSCKNLKGLLSTFLSTWWSRGTSTRTRPRACRRRRAA